MADEGMRVILGEIGDLLVASPDEGSRTLRRLQDELRDSLVHKADTLSELQRADLFFLDLLLDDIFYNLAGDFPYKDEMRESFLQTWNMLLARLGEAIRVLSTSDDYGSSFRAFAGLTSFYLDTIEQFNKQFEQKELQ